MSNYSKSTNFATKDNLTPGDPLKIVRGTEIDTEFNNIATAIATKTDNASAAITGGTINDTTIGATTASTGAFTTLAASGNVTLSGGTANGVTYLNGSKVVTSGSALTFDGQTLTNTRDTPILVLNDTAASNSALRLLSTGGISYIQSGISGGSFASLAFTANGGGSEQMRLTSTGLGIGTSSPSQKLDVNGNITSTAWIGRANGSAPSADCAIYRATDNTLGFSTASTERMRLDSSGNLGIGTSSPSTRLHVAGATSATSQVTTQHTGSSITTVFGCDGGIDAGAVYVTTNHPLAFKTNNTERARIDSSGNLLCGTTSSSNTPSQGITLMQNTNVGSIGIGHANGTSSGNGYMNFAYNGSAIGSITQSGTTAVLYNTTSDQRLKENIQNADSASAIIDALQVRKFDWKSDNSHQRYGFVAQELVTVAPEAVHQPEDTNEMMAVDYSKLVPMLVKEVQSLRKRLADAGL